MTDAAIHRVLDAHPIEDLDAALAVGVGVGLTTARSIPPDEVIALIEAAGLRGRGGAGFPTGRKWRSIASSRSASPTVVVNAAEGEPGTFKDRAILRANPYRVLEGALIAATVLGSRRIVVATKDSFVDEIARLDTAIAEITAAGWCDDVAIDVVRGPGAYLFGEETAILEVIDGRPPFPRIAPPYRRGIHDRATGDAPDSVSNEPAVLVDNVETFANVPSILAQGVKWFRSVGTEQSPGTIVCTVTGDTRWHGVAEFAMGTPLATVLEVIGGGTTHDRTLRFVLPGVSNPVLTAEALSTPLTYEDMSAIGSGLGSATFIVIDDDHSLGSVLAGAARFLSVESCGQCTPCKRDGLAIADALRRPDRLHEIDESLRTVTRGARCALAGQLERIVATSIDDLRAAVSDGADQAGDVEPYPILPLVDIVHGRAVYDGSFVDKRADWSYFGESADSDAWPAERLENQPVTIGSPHVAEGDGSLDGVIAGDPTGHPDPFAPIRSLQQQIEADFDDLRALPADQRSGTCRRLHHDVHRHARFMTGIVYPLLERLATDGDDISWYPHFHEQHAVRLLDRTDTSAVAVTDQMLDAIASDMHIAVIESNLRILPALAGALRNDPDETRRVVGAITTMLA